MAEYMKEKTVSSINAEEIDRFSAIAATWWDASGPFRPLHLLNPTRLCFIRQSLLAHFYPADAAKAYTEKPFAGLKILDIGCGGGLMTEPLTRLGAQVTGIDASEKTIDVAKAHAQLMGLDIDYQCLSAEELWAQGAQFDAVLALEIVEHVDSVPAFLKTCTALTAPNGALFMSTINRTWKAWAVAIIGAEYVLRWLPKGTHTWEKFITPAELSNYLRTCDFRVRRLDGLTFSPLSQQWSLTKDLDVNYLLYAHRS